MPRPLGLWLPAPCWLPDHSTSPVLASAPWLSVLPPALSHSLQQCLAASLDSRTYVGGNTLLPAASPQQCRGLTKSRLQVQQHLMQLWLEALAGQHLGVAGLPRKAKVLLGAKEVQKQTAAGARGNRRGGGGDGQASGDPRVERLLAHVRLAHMLLTKNAFNRVLCVVEATTDK